MGAPISSGLANLAMEVMLERISSLLPFDLPFLYIFVDDLLTAIPEGIINETLEMFNAINSNIQFTIETEKEKELPYLDLKLIHKNDGTISTEFYQKPCASGRILNFRSNHSTSLKVNTAIGLIKRVFTFSPNKSDNDKKLTVTNILKSNNFPKKLINKLISDYKDKKIQNTETPIDNAGINQQRKKYSSIKYIRGLTEAINRKIQSFDKNITISTPPERSLQPFFTKLKDKTPQEQQSKLIYKVPCSICDKYYIGMTWKQYMDTRMLQHKRQQNRILKGETTSGRTAITDHAKNEKHPFDFSQAKIIDRSNNYHHLKTLEMLHISSNENSCNFRSDVANTVQQYQSLIFVLKNRNLI